MRNNLAIDDAEDRLQKIGCPSQYPVPIRSASMPPSGALCRLTLAHFLHSFPSHLLYFSAILLVFRQISGAQTFSFHGNPVSPSKILVCLLSIACSVVFSHVWFIESSFLCVPCLGQQNLFFFVVCVDVVRGKYLKSFYSSFLKCNSL